GAIRRVIRKVLRNIKVTGGVLCSVVPQLNGLWNREMTIAIGQRPFIVNHRLKLGVKLAYPKPGSIGADRLANICGAFHKYGHPVLVADFGTAATFDVITSKGSYIGGVIAPGLRLMSDYMADRTALLPRITINGTCPGIGRCTEDAMRIGAFIGYRGLIREITEYLIKHNDLGHITLIATGGLATTVLKGINLRFHIDQNLTLYGLYRIFQLNNAQ
ncbi:MAG: type III pantothenate kinase, partial [Kiritimatiellae bacterium]|nr:type III pantothenate kinase [Kiritimatiellia bacterium]